MASFPPAHPTPYEEVNILLHLLFARVQTLLADQLVGFYLYGSLSLGDFDPGSSDVDFLVVTAQELPEETLERLRTMHAEIAVSGLAYATKLEGSYIPRAALRSYDPNKANHPSIGVDWSFQIRPHGSNWILERSIVREHGIVLWGPTPQALIDPIPSHMLRAAVCEQLQSMWQHQLHGPEWLHPRDYQAFAVLTLCRALYTLHLGVLCSKPQAASWVREVYPDWQPVVDRSIAWRHLHETDDMTETLTFLREAVDKAQELCERISHEASISE